MACFVSVFHIPEPFEYRRVSDLLTRHVVTPENDQRYQEEKITWQPFSSSYFFMNPIDTFDDYTYTRGIVWLSKLTVPLQP